MDRTRALDACVSAVKCIRSGHGFCSYNCNHSQMVDMPALADWYYSLQDDVRKEMQSDETITRAILGYENFFKSFEMSRGFSSTTVFRWWWCQYLPHCDSCVLQQQGCLPEYSTWASNATLSRSCLSNSRHGTWQLLRWSWTSTAVRLGGRPDHLLLWSDCSHPHPQLIRTPSKHSSECKRTSWHMPPLQWYPEEGCEHYLRMSFVVYVHGHADDISWEFWGAASSGDWPNSRALYASFDLHQDGR